MPSFAKFAAMAAFVLSVPAKANDSEAEVGIGGITLLPSAALVMASEDLFISQRAIRVKYRFVNPGAQPVRTTVAFPLPGQPRGTSSGYWLPADGHDWNAFQFTTRVNGRAVPLTRVDRAKIGERDVTVRIKALGLPLAWYADAAFIRSVPEMPEPRRRALIAEGLLRNDKRYGELVPAWDVVTHFVREQTFAANSSVTVEHEYAPITGGSVAGSLLPAVRKGSPEIITDYTRDYCTDTAFWSGFDARLAEHMQRADFTTYSEDWLGYVLSSGANWKGPIGDFRLVVDKGKADNLVSFCMDGVRKISPTQFEVRKRNFEPRRDLKVLIVMFHHEADQ